MSSDPAANRRRGTVAERPWGVTLGALASSRATGQLTLTAEDGKAYCVAFVGGAVVGASSPLVADSIARIALTSHLVSSTQVPALARLVAASPGRDEVEVLAVGAKLSREQTVQLRRKLLIQRAARTFSVDRGEYVFDEQITVSSMPGVEVDLAPALLLGARMNLSEERLAEDLRQLGTRFVLSAEAVDPARFGFGDAERPLLQALRVGTSLPELEAKHRELEPRATRAVIYALVASGACEGLGPQTASRELAEAAAAAVASSAIPEAVAPMPSLSIQQEEVVDYARARTVTFESPPTPAPAPRVRPPRPEQPTPRTRTISSSPPPAVARQAPVFAAREVIAAGIALLDIRADHFALLGVARDASLDAIRSAYVSLACHLHPDKLPELDPAATRDAQRLFAHVNLAFGVLTDPARRADYVASLDRSPGRPAAQEAPAAAMFGAGPTPTGIERARAAADFVQRGLRALRREDLAGAVELLQRATELAPTDVDIAATLAWARFCASSDKAGIAPEVRRVLERAVFKSPKPVQARFYLGRVERMLGRIREALHHFHEVIALEPGHSEAAAEIRLLEPRGASRRGS